MRLAVGNAFSDDIAIDLGTVNTIVHVMGRGVVIDEPSVVAVRTGSGHRDVLAVGQQARQMLGRTPGSIETIRPLRDGVIADFVATEEMLRQFIKRTRTSFLDFRRPRILICVPAGATPVERRAVYETAVQAGARRVYIVEEPVAAAIGAGLPIDDPSGSMAVDIGGGTTDIAVLALGGVIEARSLRIAGNAMDEAIIRYIRREHQLIISEPNAERIKIEAGSASRAVNGLTSEIHIRGRDLLHGKPKGIVLLPQHVAEALEEPIEAMAEFIERTLEDLPPEISSDICDRGIYLTGGGALLHKLDQELERRVGVPFLVSENPLHCVVRGSALLLANIDRREHLLIHP
jgi:rod shape-determining protein MreB